jgi:carbonic anhydrase
MDAKQMLQLLSVLGLILAANVASVNGASDSEQTWSYDGSGAPHFWDELDPENHNLCGTGKIQSPINLGNDPETQDFVTEKPITAVSVNWSDKTDFKGSDLVLKNYGYTVQVQGTFGDNYTTEYLGETFKLLQFHFHTPSEHRVDGDFSPLEVHFVHKTDGGKLAVLGIMMDIASNAQVKSDFLTAIVPLLKDVQEVNTTTPMPYLDVNQALKEANGLANGLYTYTGSLTTPPCIEGVNWMVAKDRLKVSAYQFNTIKNLTKYSARQTQPRAFPPAPSPPKGALKLTAAVVFNALIAALVFSVLGLVL